MLVCFNKTDASDVSEVRCYIFHWQWHSVILWTVHRTPRCGQCLMM